MARSTPQTEPASSGPTEKRRPTLVFTSLDQVATDEGIERLLDFLCAMDKDRDQND